MGLFINEFEYHLVENELTAKDFIRLKVATRFKERPIEQVEKALNKRIKYEFDRNIFK